MTTEHCLVDSFGRRVTTLRVSLTDHCNFRCVYCMPPEGLPFLDRSHYLTRQEITRFVDVASRSGVARVKLTGGEPLLRKDIVEIVRSLREIPGVQELSLTTNGSLLAPLASALKNAGLDRINISLDSIDADRFAETTRVAQLDHVLAGIDAARRVGFPIKLNVVVMRGMTVDEILSFADMAFRDDIDVRFLEFMPLCGSGWQGDQVFPIGDVRDAVLSRYVLSELERGDRPAQTFEIVGGRGRVGFIASLTEPFCGACSRMRLTADGKIRPCLFSNYEYSIASLLQGEATDQELTKAIQHAVLNKPWGSEFMNTPFEKSETIVRTSQTSPLIRSIGG